MGTLWNDVYLSTTYEWPRSLSEYPHTASKRALSFVRNVTLWVYEEPDDSYPTSVDFYELFEFMSGCFRMLKDTRAIDTMNLHVGLYDPNNYQPDCNDIIEAINSTTWRILKRVRKMKLQALGLHTGRKTARLVDLLSILKQNVDNLEIDTSPITALAPLLQSFPRLKTLEVRVSESQPRSLQAETTFWTVVSQLPTLKSVWADTIPIPPPLDSIHFSHLINLRLYFYAGMVYGEWTRSLVTIFQQMPVLEKLLFSHVVSTSETRAEGRAMQITTIASTNLKHLELYCTIPIGLVSTIAKHCRRLTLLTICDFAEADNVDDEDLRQLSVSCPNLQKIRFQSAKHITSLEYFAAFHHLEVLKLFYPAGKFIDKSLLLKLVESCPKLAQIIVTDNPNT